MPIWGLLAEKYGQAIRRLDSYEYISLPCGQEGGRFRAEFSSERERDNYEVYLMTLEDYNHLTGKEEELIGDQAMIYSSGVDYGYREIDFMGITVKIRKEVRDLFPYPKEEKNRLRSVYVLVVKDKEMRDTCIRAWASVMSESPEALLENIKQKTGIVLEGEDEEKRVFADEFIRWCSQQSGFFMSYIDGLEGREILYSMNGGLLFIGIVFGMVFFMCLLLIMYYKQISEGYEDRGSFEIMQKVGMSDAEIRSTVRKQILIVFAMPLLGALMHSAAGLFMVSTLMMSLRMFNTRLLIICEAGVALFFVIIYGISYLATSRTYYRIVKG